MKTLIGALIGSFLAFLLVVATGRAIDVTAGGAVPVGGIIISDAATCPAGFAEVTAARGFHLSGMPGAGTPLATVGSAKTDAQNLSVTPVFSGAALGSHTHDLPYSVSDGSALYVTTSGTGSGTATFTSTSSNVVIVDVTGARPTRLSYGTSGGTPAGTNTAVTGGGTAPYIQIVLCKKS